MNMPRVPEIFCLIYSKIHDSKRAFKTIMKPILTHNNILLAGMKVANDVKYLTNHYDEEFIGQRSTIIQRVLDVNSELRLALNN
jgi:hypothetical protein